MPDTSSEHQRKIAELQTALQLPLPASVRQQLEQSLQALVSIGAGSQTGDITIGDVAGGDLIKGAQGAAAVSGTVYGVAAGVINGNLQLFFGSEPGEDGERLLAAYLDSLITDCQQLRLHRLTGKRQSGSEQRAAPQLHLQDVYTSLTTDGPPITRPPTQAPAGRVRRFIERLERSKRTPDTASPERVLLPTLVQPGERQQARGERLLSAVVAHMGLGEVADETEVWLALTRPELALEAIRAERRLVLLGEPGAGKSTVLRYLALLLALRLRGHPMRLPGWPIDDTPVPVVVPLGRVAAALHEGGTPYDALMRVIGDLLDDGLRSGLRRFLAPALREGGILLLCDGLDELPATAAEGGESPRAAVAGALRRLSAQTRARIVVTSRVLPYQAPGDWKLLPEEGWSLRTIQPLAFGQVRAFVRGWYAALVGTDPELHNGKAEERAAALIEELASTERLRPLVRAPLLLTMLAILHYNTGDVPPDRARLYEECVQLLLERWEPERQPGVRRESLRERLGLPSLDPLRQVIHELAYRAHAQPPGDDGRGLIDGATLDGRMLRFFERSGPPAEAGRKVQLLREALRDEEAGLLQERGDDGYALPHLTFQEYLAACHLADHPQMAELAYGHWNGADRERWREALLLLMGRLQQQGKAEEKGLPWLKQLWGARRAKLPKAGSQHRRDTVLAALSYAELAERGAFNASMLDLTQEIDEPLRAALVLLLDTPDAAIALDDRIAAARLLAGLGDPRFPVELGAWRTELAQRNALFGQPTGYWCYVREGTYPIGGWGEEEPTAKIALAAFWVARFPITVAQYTSFVAEGYGKGAKHWWTPEGWKWKRKRREPWGWNSPEYHVTNQPVIGVSWYEAVAFCAWLTAKLGTALPTGYVIRLPSEAEWETAAAFDGDGQRLYPWGADEPTSERAIYDASGLGQPAPVGCCPAGAAACGALDMAGNVWEVTASSFKAYPALSDKLREDFTPGDDDVPWRGGSYGNNSTYVRCGARVRSPPGNLGLYVGFRVVLAPALAQMS